MKTGQFIKRGKLSVEIATFKAFLWQDDEFNLNSITNTVRAILLPYRPESTTISSKLRKLRDKGEINYNADFRGVYTKINDYEFS